MKRFVFLLLILSCICAQAQFYDLGQDPASVKWMCIKTQHFKIIFPKEIEQQAQHVANMLEQAYIPVSASLKVQPVKIPVVLHNRAVISNAEVPWAPKRIEFYTCPDQEDYAQPWLDQLVVHEFRHVAQYSKINKGFTKILSYLFGQQITVGVMGAFVPFWYIEGDAVCTETAMSRSGRGRVPAFEMELRAQVLQKGWYRYDKAALGSYTTYIPDRYILGYNIVATARKHFTNAVWEQAMNRTSKLPFMVVPFSSGIKKVSHLNKVGLYKFCLRELDSLWTLQDKSMRKTGFELISTQKNKFYTSYNRGGFLNNTSCIVAKSGVNDITRFVRIDSAGNEHRVFTPGDYASASLNASSGRIVWAESVTDPRWDNRTFSIIKTHDVLKNKTRQLTHRSRYFAPALSHSGDKIACVEQTTTGRSFIAILDAKKGSLLKRIAADSNDFLMMPSWADDDTKIVFVALNKDGKRICMLDSAGKIHQLTSPSFVEINKARMQGNKVYFVGAYSGINNIYVLNITTNTIFQVTSSQFGADDPDVSPDGIQLIYSDYSANGYRLVKAPIDTLQWIALQNVTDNSVKLCESLTQGESGVLDFYKPGQTEYRVKRYSKFLNLFDVHSWGPISIDADNTTVKPGFEILSQNPLSTMVTSLGYEHEWNMPTSDFYAKISYRGWYPQIDLTLKYELDKDDTINWDVFSAQINVKVPLKLTKGKFYMYLEPQLGFTYYDVLGRKNYSSDAFSGYFQAMEYHLYGYNIMKTSQRDINPRWGQVLNVNYKHTPFNGANLGNIWSVESILYFPGIGKHHSLNAYIGWQQNNAVDFAFNDIISFPQQIKMSGFHQLLVGKFAYEMPLFYPDWSIGSLIYIKRFRAGFYYDQAWATDWNNTNYTARSAGVAILADFHALRFLAPITLGVRTTYRFGDGAIIPELVYSINFAQIYFKPPFSRFNN